MEDRTFGEMHKDGESCHDSIRELAGHELDRVRGGGSKPGGAGNEIVGSKPGGAGDGILVIGITPSYGSKPGGTTDG